MAAHGKAVAVLSCSVDTIYPKACTKLAEDILDNGGCILSTYPTGTHLTKYNFLERDKVQVKLANKICVITCDESGGTMYTVKNAYKEGKPIGTVLSSSGTEYIKNNYHAKSLGSDAELLEFARLNAYYEQMDLFSMMAN